MSIKQMEYNKKYLIGIGAALFPCMIAVGSNIQSSEKGNKIPVEMPAEKPNIIFFISDDMERIMFNCLPEGKGKNLTPNIDLLAREGVVLLGQHVSSSVCTPSRYSCLMGQYASRSASDRFISDTRKNEGVTVVQWNSYIPNGTKTIGTLLQQQGYRTGFVGKNHVIEAPGWKKLALNADPADPKVKQELLKNARIIEENIKRSGFDFAGANYQDNPHYLGPEKLRSQNLDWVTAKGLEFMDQKSDQPFFLYFATTVPHGPSDAAHSWNGDRRITSEGYLDKVPDVLPAKETIAQRLIAAGLAKPGKIPDEKANTVWIDDAVGALMKKLKETGKYDNTIIVFFTDHGQWAKGSVYEGGVSSPSIIWKKGGFKCGSVNSDLLSNIDFAPTLYEMAGGNPETISSFDGKSFLPILNGEKREIHESLYFEMGFSRGVLKDSLKYIALRYPEFANNWTIEQRKDVLEKWNKSRMDNKMSYHYTDPEMPFSHVMLIPGGGDAEHLSTKRYKHYFEPNQLYDLRNDPEEQHNLYGKPEYSAKQEELKTELKKYLNMLPGNFGEFKKHNSLNR
jgi:arylsulfatase A-like enzyme